MNEAALKVLKHIWRFILLFNDVFQLVGYLHSIENNEFVEAVDFSKKYYLSCVASIGFGLNIDCFGEKKSTFEEKAK